MRTLSGMILGALMLVGGVYVYDSMQTSSVANGQVAQANRTIVNWDVAAADWAKLKTRAHDDWVKISSKSSRPEPRRSNAVVIDDGILLSANWPSSPCARRRWPARIPPW